MSLKDRINFTGRSGRGWSYFPSSPIGPPGGFGQVFHGEGDLGGVSVAVKGVNRPDLHPRLRDREAEIADVLMGRDLQHVLIPLDIAEVGEDLLIVMPRADGSLADVVGSVEPRTVFLQIARGLHELHQAGIIHRDLKPGNVLRFTETWKLSDFGIARIAEHGTGTFTFKGWGTDPYMAPELWDGVGSPDVRSDLYALGCVGYELVTGKTPFGDAEDRDDFEIAHRSLSPASLPSGTEPALARSILKLLAKSPSERPTDARAVVEAVGPKPTPQLSGLLQAATDHEAEKLSEAADRGAEAMRSQASSDLWHQGIVLLNELANDCVALIRRALPVDLSRPDRLLNRSEERNETQAADWRLSSEDGELSLIVWPTVPTPPGDPRPGAVGEALGLNRRLGSKSVSLANLVFEDRGDGWRWYVYRFARNPLLMVRYRHGPPGRQHGLKSWQFGEGWQHMVTNAIHEWQLQRDLLTAQELVDLLEDAMRLHPKTPTRWPPMSDGG